MKMIAIYIVIFCSVILSACETIEMVRPEGFAYYKNINGGNKSVSPERVVYKVSTHANEKNANLAFWKIALKTHMKDSGYIFLSETDVVAKSITGYLLTLAAPAAGQDYTYVIALFVHKNKLVVIEAAGETQSFSRYEKDIIKTIENSDILAAVKGWNK